MVTPASSSVKANGAQAVKTATGQFIAKATSGYSPWRRAQDAAHWLRGELNIKPTVKLALKPLA
jgi:hypothetical protein